MPGLAHANTLQTSRLPSQLNGKVSGLLPGLVAGLVAGLVVLLLTILVSSLAPWISSDAFAQVNSKEQQAVEQQLAQLQQDISALQQSLAAARSDYQAEQQQLKQLDLSIQQSTQAIRALQSLIAEQTTELDRLEEQREAQLQQLQLDQAQLSEQINGTYRLARESRLKLILNQDSPAGLSRMLAYYEHINRAQAAKIVVLKDTLASLEEIHTRIAAQLLEISSSQARQEQELQTKQDQRQQRQQLMAQLDLQIDSDEARLLEFEKNRLDLERLLEKLSDVLADIPSNLGQHLAVSSQKGRLPTPVQSRVRKAFGQNRGGGMYWQGWVFDALPGVEVNNIAYGRVAFADWLRGYGLMIIIDHGEGFMSLYGYNESLLAEVGDWVEPGNVIAHRGINRCRRAGAVFRTQEGWQGTRPGSMAKTLEPGIQETKMRQAIASTFQFRVGISLMTFLLLTWQSIAIGQQGSTPASAAETSSSEASTNLNLDDLRTFTDVFNQVRKNYVESVDDRQLLESAIVGMLSELDPHSAYLPGDDFEDLDHNARGEYVGIGVDVAAEKGRIVVRKVIVPSPADSAGINPGDIFTSIDGKVVKGRVLQEAIDELSGPAGTEVEIVVLDEDGVSDTRKIKREVLKVPALTARRFADNILYFSLSYFHRDSATDLQDSIKNILSDNPDVNGIILDLRNNPGGVLQSAVEIADRFLDSGTIVSIRGRNSSLDMEFSAAPGQWFAGAPVVLLVDRGSASASEVVAGTLPGSPASPDPG